MTFSIPLLFGTIACMISILFCIYVAAWIKRTVSFWHSFIPDLLFSTKIFNVLPNSHKPFQEERHALILFILSQRILGIQFHCSVGQHPKIDTRNTGNVQNCFISAFLPLLHPPPLPRPSGIPRSKEQ